MKCDGYAANIISLHKKTSMIEISLTESVNNGIMTLIPQILKELVFKDNRTFYSADNTIRVQFESTN